MRFNSKILYAIISLAFVGGMFSAVYAGSVIATITLDGNVHTTGDLNVDGAITGPSFAALDARISALEAGTDPTLPIVSMVLSNEGMIGTHDTTLTTHDTTLTTHGTTLTTHGNTLTLHNDMIEANAEAIAEGGGGYSNECNPNGDSQITAQEIVDMLAANGIPQSTVFIINFINNIESSSPPENQNSILDTVTEVTQMNGQYVTPLTGVVCELP